MGPTRRHSALTAELISSRPQEADLGLLLKSQPSAPSADWGAVGAVASWLAVLVAVVVGLAVLRQVRLMRDQNAMQVLVQVFEKHQSRLSAARTYVFMTVRLIPTDELHTRGIEAIDPKWRDEVVHLAWFYDHVGLLVSHGVVDLEPISGYMGDTVIRNWRILEPLIMAERRRRRDGIDDLRWQRYFENLYQLILDCPPSQARGRQRHWVLEGEPGRGSPMLAAFRAGARTGHR
jgi:hypothetical protein